MKTSLFTGCVIPIRYPGMEVATRELAPRLGVDFVDVKFGCCPAPTGLKAAHFDAYLALAARNLCLAEEEGLDVITICSGCTNTLREANHILAEDEKKRLFVHDLLRRRGKHFRGSMVIRHLADFLASDGLLARLAEKVERPLTGLKVGTHYGCHYYRPTRMMRDEAPDPRYPLPESMELVLEALGADVVEYNRQDLCCGAALGINAGLAEEALKIAQEKVDWMNEAGVEALVTACPTCFGHFDTGQVLMRRKDKARRLIPVYHLAELVAYALGVEPERLDLKSHKVKTPLVNPAV